MEGEKSEKEGRRCRWLSFGSAISETITILVPVGGGRGFRSGAMTARERRTSLSKNEQRNVVRRWMKKDGCRPRSSAPGTPPSNIKCRINAGHDRPLPRLCNGVRVHETVFPLSASSSASQLCLHA